MNDADLHCGLHVNFREKVYDKALPTGETPWHWRESVGFIIDKWNCQGSHYIYKVHEDASRTRDGYPYNKVECAPEDILSIFKPPCHYFD
jgi:hypothetical protein